MCGGSLEILPCSRVGHLFRTSTYSFGGNQNEITTRNNNRLMKVWMDDFQDIIYAAYPSKIHKLCFSLSSFDNIILLSWCGK